ncbi:hypothetical protein TNCT_402761 [Trichonephila clavata]|uniref:Uncharacterized protein n=1 Tax=Trichonephila clavata TaxID=2740835 RepID=A0A8X6KLE9_TRICU|nr:hypothetical protein TNCT_402761 [Trichonephila clavata]
MDKPTTSSMTDEHSCIRCEKLDSSSENNSDLGDIIKISRGVTTLELLQANDRMDCYLTYKLMLFTPIQVVGKNI